MHYRELGKTGLRVSAIGMGCVQLSSSRTEVAVEIVRRALDLGVTYFDVARSYGDSEIKLGLGLAGRRDTVVVSTKTGAKSRDDAWRQLEESLTRLQMDYVDNCHLHSLRSGDDLDRRLGPGGALEALLEAKEQGLVRHIGCTSHRSEAIIEALDRFDFEVILVPMNVVEREPLDALIPLCREKGVAVTIMKPLATGLLPATLALRWLLNQPIATAVPGTTTLAELEENVAAGSGAPALSPEEAAAVEEIRAGLDHVRCRICGACMPCPQEIGIPWVLGTDVMYDHHRTMGPEAFRAFPWSREQVAKDLEKRRETITKIAACTRCGACEDRCPYGLPAMAMLQAMLPGMADMVEAYEAVLAEA